MPSSEPRLINGLEVWMAGTPRQIELAMGALREVMGVAPMWSLQPLAGADAGRYRTYVRGFPREPASNSP